MESWMSKRYSCRAYKKIPLNQVVLDGIRNHAKDFYFPQHLVLDWQVHVIEDGRLVHDAFKGLLSTYAKVVAPHYLLLSCESHANSGFLLGFLGESFVKYLTENGLGSCWIGFPIDSSLVLKIGKPKAHSIYILIAFGEPEEAKAAKKQRKYKELSKIGYELNEDAQWLYEALQCAPSAMNSQPWQLFYRNGQYHYALDTNPLLYRLLKDKHLIDLGIGFFHIYDAIKSRGYRMSWDFIQNENKAQRSVLTFKYFI